MNIRTIGRWLLGAMVVSFAGLWVCRLADPAGAFARSALGGVLEMAFTIGACAGLVVMAVCILVLKRPTPKEIAERLASGEIDLSQMTTGQRLAFYANFGSLPRWLYLPVLSVAVGLTAITVLALIGMVVWMVVTW